MVRVKTSIIYRLSVSYDFYDEDYQKIEKLIDDAVGKRSDGSGAGFGQRDLGYYFKTLKACEKPLKKLIRLAKKIEREKANSFNISISITY